MALEKRPIPFDEFTEDVEGFFERVIHGHETLLVEKTHGEFVILKAARSRRPRRVQRSKRSPTNEAFLSTAGGWKDLVDTDRLIEDIYESRNISSRPPIQL
jgi:hypothetical protein